MDKSDEAEAAMKLNQPDLPPEYTLPPPRIWPQYIVTIAATLCSFAIAAATVTTLNFIYLDALHHDEFSWFFLTRYLGAALGAPLLGLLAHFCGRKWAAILIQLLLILALSMALLIHNKPCLFLSAFILGTAIGGQLAIIPIYVTEIADDMHRGVLGNFILLLPVLCQLLGWKSPTWDPPAVFSLQFSGFHQFCRVMTFIGAYMVYFETFVTEYWLAMLFCMLLSLLALVAAVLMPETPPFLISKGRRNEAAKVLRLLRGEYRQEWEIQALESSFSKKASILKPFMISLGLMTLQSLLFIEYSMMAAQLMLREIFDGFVLSAAIMVLFGSVSLIAGAVAVYFIKWRLLLLISCIGTTVGSLVVCLGFLAFESPIVSTLAGFLTIASFFSAAGYLPQIVMAQLLPRKSNAITFSLITAFCLFLKFLQLYIFNFVVEFQYGTILVPLGSALFTIYVFLFIPELKRKSVQTIQDELSHKSFIILTL